MRIARVIVLLALGIGNLSADGETGTAVEDVTLPQTDELTSEEALQAWQEYSNELEQTVRTMQERETAYRQQLEAANDTITQLEGEINGGSTGYDDDDDEYDEHEYDDDDDDEHEQDDDDDHEEREHGFWEDDDD